jgi:uncharacterized UBP type Zn finger protein
MKPFVLGNKGKQLPNTGLSSLMYNLHAGANHMGNSGREGHYTAYVESHLDRNLYKIDNHVVTQVLNPAEVVTKDGYSLFHRRRAASTSIMPPLLGTRDAVG